MKVLEKIKEKSCIYMTWFIGVLYRNGDKEAKILVFDIVLTNLPNIIRGELGRETVEIDWIYVEKLQLSK